MEAFDQKVQRLFDILPNQLAQFPKEDALCDKIGGSWRKFSTSACIEMVDQISFGLVNLGFQPGEKFAIISYNRTEWPMLDLGILQMGGIDVPLYPNMSSANYEFIFNDSQVKLVFVENEELFKKVKKVIPKTPSVKDIYTFNEVVGAKNWLELAKPGNDASKEKLKDIESKITPLNLATIIYTSGTTGVPKGVPLTHLNILSNVKSITEIMPMTHKDRMISFLPICHIFERTAVYFYLYLGGSVYFAESIEKVGENLKEIKPNYFTTVPRLMEKIYDKIMDKGRNLSPAKKAIFGWAVNLANHYDPRGENSLFYKVRLIAARKLVFSKWMEALGGEVKGIISGAAALQPRLSRIFTAAGATIREGYGLTETSPVLTCNRFSHGEYYLGSVGIPLPGVEIKLSETGEILAKGDNVMKGYYNNDEATKQVIDEDGWFHTGDIGEWVDGKFLKITDRVKEIFKTSGGKFIAPLPIENKMKESNFISEIMVVGENQKHASGIIVPNFDFIRKWAEKKCPDVKTNEEIAKSPIVKDRIWKDVQKYNKRFGQIQQLKKIVLVADTWTVESGELTPTLKLKRRVILAKYKELIEKIYND